MIPSCDQTGTPLHFHSSTISGSASLTRLRSRLSIVPRQSASSSIRSSMIWSSQASSCPFLLRELVIHVHADQFDLHWHSSVATFRALCCTLSRLQRPASHLLLWFGCMA